MLEQPSNGGVALAELPCAVASTVSWQNPSPAPLYRFVAWGDECFAVEAALEATQFGGRVALVARDFPAALGSERTREVVGKLARAARDPLASFDAAVDAIRRGSASRRDAETAWRLTGYGVDVFLGAAAFSGQDCIDVAGQSLRFHRAAVAVPKHALHPTIDGLTEVGGLTLDSISTLPRLPRRVVVIGSGPELCAMVQALRRFGSAVHVIQRGLSLLPDAEPFANESIQRALHHEGVHLHLGWSVEQIEKTGAAKALVIQRHGQRQKLLADEILYAFQNETDVRSLGLANAGVRCNLAGMLIDDRGRTTNAAVYALEAGGDWPRSVVRNALAGGKARRSRNVVPSVIYTDPQVAQVGLTVATADTMNLTVEVHRHDFPDGGVALVLTCRGTRRIVGATVVAPGAAEMIGQVALAMAHGLPHSALRFSAI